MMYDEWIDIVPRIADRAPGTTDTSDTTVQQVRTWSLVLSSQFIPHRVSASRGERQIWVNATEADEAVSQIRLYEQENAEWAPGWLPARTFSSARASFSVLALIGLAHFITTFGVGYSRSLWIAVGSADAGLILRGEWWRVVTALTLHSDVVHLLSNVVIGGFFILWLCRELGAGLSWSLVLLSGMAGNAINALVQSPLHNSIGASTAVFGAIGILSGLRMHESAAASRSVFVPLVAGIILLALLGSGGERTDVGAHLFGLISGLAIGAGLSAWLKSNPIPTRDVQRILGVIAIATPIIAWTWGFDVKV
jgi:membrane associated rhomboid family serine protease